MPTPELIEKLKTLPSGPGVYFHKNSDDKTIYIGKAARLNNRVRQYFQKSRARDPKTEALVAEIADTTWIEVETELDALFLEAELIRRYLPPYNILLRDDKALSYVRIDIKSNHPTISLVRRPLDDDAKYFGPYFSAFSVKKALKFLRRVFPFDWQKPGLTPRRASLDYHIGLSPGLEQNKTSLEDYRANLRQLMRYLKGERTKIMQEIEQAMKRAAKAKQFEKAAIYRNRLRILQSFQRQVVFSDREFMDISKDQGLYDLAEVLGLYKSENPRDLHLSGVQDADEQAQRAVQYSTVSELRSPATQQSTKSTTDLPGFAGQKGRVVQIPRRIEGYDISHMSGTDTVASMVVFVNGLPDKASYRKFKLQLPGNDDFAHMREVMTRRLHEPNVKKWGMPNLFLIDGGKGQLGSALEVLGQNGINLPAIGLAKQFEEIIIKKDWPFVNLDVEKVKKLKGTLLQSDEYWQVNLPNDSHVVKLLQRIRDESHRFAVSYHTVLKRARTSKSLLDEVPTIGPETKKKLLRTFGSYKGIEQARQFELEKLIGTKKATILRQYIRANKKA